MQDCIFCKIVKGEIPSEKVYETDSVLAFNDIAPAAPVHVLVIPKKHLEHLSNAIEADGELVYDVMKAVDTVAKKVKIEAAYKATTNNGEGAGQVVPHFHFHVLGGWKSKDGVVSEIHKNDSQ